MVSMMNQKSQEHSRNFFFFFKFSRHIGGAKVIIHRAPTEQFFAVSPENTDFSKKLFNMKLFNIKFVMEKVLLNFGVR